MIVEYTVFRFKATTVKGIIVLNKNQVITHSIYSSVSETVVCRPTVSRGDPPDGP
jgi:hypothetical protein